jgi:hypothetical protein
MVRFGCRAGEEPVQFAARLVIPGVRDPLELTQDTIAHRTSGEQLPRTHAAFVQQVVNASSSAWQ